MQCIYIYFVAFKALALLRNKLLNDLLIHEVGHSVSLSE